jgi:hypothetical protein
MIDTVSPQLEAVIPEENYLLKYTTPALSNTIGGKSNTSDYHTGNANNTSQRSADSGRTNPTLKELIERDVEVLAKLHGGAPGDIKRTPTFSSEDIDPTQSLA